MALLRIAGGQDGLVTRAQATRIGFTRHEIDNLVTFGRWRRLARAVYLASRATAEEPSRRCLIRAALLSLGPKAHAVLGTAAELHGIAGLPRSDEIHVALPGVAAKLARAQEPGLVVHQLEHPAASIVSLGGLAATDPLTTVTEVILRVGRYPAVCVLDSALNRGLIDGDDLLAIPRLIRGRRGAVAARGYLAEADGRAQSPLETRTRLRCVDGKVPPDALQLEVRDDDGYLLGIGDLGWRGPKVIAEADGRGPHGTPEAAYADRRRQNRLVNAGWTILRFTWPDTLDPHYIPQTIRQAVAAAQRRRS
ncbi:type IV toxin-antitoxin system AbiEi family antitoxin domain-containing protein [Micromonospora sp. C28SCA-DRY-2]|uniref:type IV toxin-antitoxin system AbiEi family antitoxin domain-containing protein n=1 Tax=Micromonospora sp. C28SCA-DRY-2 TaxID=3059522 RepID=UPI002675FDB7|nr:type IV toxin-antitoxin system AbiEi family antitoxin domain-containing protein [Micromonospora sp. C28SCA-DRY-2]MDO3703939.1 type IV toxin-antitoxin system AbiEi family antitoxin domain-containing protein [Micromonospora sp. C28SCA-DRY-2]